MSLEVFGRNWTTNGRQHRDLALDNELKVILVSDHEAETAATCLYVPVRSMYDPENCLGMAQFLEHMIFLPNGKCTEKETGS